MRRGEVKVGVERTAEGQGQKPTVPQAPPHVWKAAQKIYRTLLRQGRSEAAARRDAERWVLGNYGIGVDLAASPSQPPIPSASLEQTREEERLRQQREAQQRAEREQEERVSQHQKAQQRAEREREEEWVRQQQEIQRRAERKREERLRQQHETQRRAERTNKRSGSGPILAPGSRPEDIRDFERSSRRWRQRFDFGNILGVSFSVGVAILTGAVAGVLFIYPILPGVAVEAAKDMQQWVDGVFGG